MYFLKMKIIAYKIPRKILHNESIQESKFVHFGLNMCVSKMFLICSILFARIDLVVKGRGLSSRNISIVSRCVC